MEWLWQGLRQLVCVVLLCGVVEMVLPEGGMRRAAGLVSGFLLLLVLVGMLRGGIDALAGAQPQAGAGQGFRQEAAVGQDAYAKWLESAREET